MFYSKRKKFSVYKDYYANDVLLSDATFHQQESTPKKGLKAGRDGGEDGHIGDILTLGDITNVADHVVSTRNQSPLKKVEKESQKVEEPPHKVVKPQRFRSRGDKSSTQRPKSHSRKKKEKKKLKPRPTAFHITQKDPQKQEKQQEHRVQQDTAQFGNPTNDIQMDEVYENPTVSHQGPTSSSSLEVDEVPFILTKSSFPSLQLSEFYQPPRSTSTPFNNTFQGYGTLKPLTPRTSTPLPVRPLGYSTPIFHFSPDDLNLDENSLSDLSIYGGSISRIMGNESPLGNKNSGDDGLFGNINSLTNKLKNSISLKEPDQQVYNDVDMSDPPKDEEVEEEEKEADDSVDKPMETSFNASNDSEAGTCTLPNKSILKAPNSSSGKPKKSVRIDESTLHKAQEDSKSSIKRSKRKLELEMTNLQSKKKVKKGAQTKYDELLALCGKEKDPLDLISR